MNLSNSLLVEVSRGTMVESTHFVEAAIINAKGDVVASWGDIDREIYARSSTKPLQAIPLVETGAADHFNFGENEVAFACASHNGEVIHADAANDILKRIGLGESSLECGPHRPYDEPSADVLIKAGIEPCRLHNNCSGKHSGFLATAVHMGDDPKGYIQEEHPVQARLIQVQSEMMDYDLSGTARGADGCGIPVIGLPLRSLARGMAKMADPSGMGAVREAAVKRVTAAMAAHPHMVAGNNRLDTIGMKALDGVSLKGGAEGVHIAIIPEKGLGIALKTVDGNGRAGEAAILWLLNHVGMISDSAAKALADHIQVPIKNSLKNVVGAINVREQG